MQIHIRRDRQQFEPYTLKQIHEYLKSGQILSSDHAWYQGSPDWVPLSTVPGVSGSDGPPSFSHAVPNGVRGDSAVLYHHVSKLKFILFSIVSFGLYEVYWFYKNWKYVGRRDGSGIRPFWRGVFSPIWCHPLCKDIDHHYGGLSTGTLVLIPLLYFLLVLASRLPDPYWLLSLVSFAPLLPLVSRIDDINRGRDVVASYYSRFSLGSVALSLIGALLLALMLVDQFGLTPSTKVVAGTEMKSSDLRYLRSADIIEDDETVLFFYSTGLVSIRDEGNVLTDRRVISYESDSDESKLAVASATFGEIKNIET